jgi:hypothetical protein
MKTRRTLWLVAVSLVLAGVSRPLAAVRFQDAFGPHIKMARTLAGKNFLTAPAPNDALGHVLYWNTIAIDASGLDHTHPGPGDPWVFGQQLGPVRAARAMAIVHIAMFEAINSVDRKFASYTGLSPAPAGTRVTAAIAQSAHDTLAAMFPSQAPSFDLLLSDDLAAMPNSLAKTRGIRVGRLSARLILTQRANDGSQIPEPLVDTEFPTSPDPGKWRQDPVSQIPLALGAYWNQVTPFTMTSADQFRLPAPPAIDSAEYTAAFNEVKDLGGDGITTPTSRTAEQTEIGTYWAYDGTPALCAPPRLYNQIAVLLGNQAHLNARDMGRMLALVNVAMADAGIASWDSKYFYQYWRPIGGIRESDPGTGPTGLGDGNPDTVGDTAFMPLGAPASNLAGVNFTPPFPAYPSGHATFGGALFETLRNFYGTDAIPFSFVSDELNGISTDVNGNVRPLVTRSFTTLSQAEEENGQSRIYLGIHWTFDKTGGITQGNQVADWAYAHLWQPTAP